RGGERRVLEHCVAACGRAAPEQEGAKVTIAEVLKRSAEELARPASLDAATRAALLHAIGGTYHGLGLYGEAVGVLEQARALRREYLGVEHADTLNSMNAL